MQAPPKELQAFGELQRKLAEGMMGAMAAALNQPWTAVCFEVRSRPGGTSHQVKLRVSLASGAVMPLMPTTESMIALKGIMQMRETLFQEPWFGMKLIITGDGQCRVEFNYDPKCVDDPAFLRE